MTWKAKRNLLGLFYNADKGAGGGGTAVVDADGGGEADGGAGDGGAGGEADADADADGGGEADGGAGDGGAGGEADADADAGADADGGGEADGGAGDGELTDEQFWAEAAKRNIKKPEEAKPNNAAARSGLPNPIGLSEDEIKAEDEFLAANPLRLAYKKAEETGQSADWAEEQVYEILSAQQDLRTFRAQAPVLMSQIRDRWNAEGLPGDIAAPIYMRQIHAMQKTGVKNALYDLEAQGFAMRIALGDAIVNGWRPGGAVAKGDEEGEGKKAGKAVTPTGGSARGGINTAKLSRGDQMFISNWSKRHNGGQPPTAKQLAAMEAEGLIG